MKNIFFLLLSFIIMGCKQSHSEHSYYHQKDPKIVENKLVTKKQLTEPDSINSVSIGYYDTYEKLLKLTFEIITEDEFLSVKSKVNISDFIPEQNHSYFYIQTTEKKHKYKKYIDGGNDKGWNGYVFLGYNPALKNYILTENSTAEGIGFGGLFLLDSVTNFTYNIVSFGDSSVESPISSPNNKYLVYYDNSVYEHKNCDIGVLKINDKSNPKKYLTEYASYHSDEFAIEKMIWKSDTSFYIKGYQENYENEKWVKKYTYYKTTLK